MYYAAFGLGSAYARIAMWKTAWTAFLQKPWVGGGPGWYRSFARSGIADGTVSPTIWHYDHPHNQYLYQASSSGILGLAALVVLMAALWRDPSSTEDTLAPAPATRSMYLCFWLLCIVETLLIHSLVISWFVVVVAVIFGGADQKNRRFDRNTGRSWA